MQVQVYLRTVPGIAKALARLTNVLYDSMDDATLEGLFSSVNVDILNELKRNSSSSSSRQCECISCDGIVRSCSISSSSSGGSTAALTLEDDDEMMLDDVKDVSVGGCKDGMIDADRFLDILCDEPVFDEPEWFRSQ